ncbi:Putative transcription factor sre2 [Cladobotryum mycophilum]|uniref:Transcription factor sre2 n=1 Tax=Cladobotryum mycophilum TaxID=491253 RepID=A0ABR0S7K5_9HYPO
MSVSTVVMNHNNNIDLSSFSKRPVINLQQRQNTQQSSPTWNSPSLESKMNAFNMSASTSAPSLPSFDPANTNNLTQMSFPQVSPSIPNQNTSQDKTSHDTKRIKVESPPPSALDNIDSLLQFDDDAEKFASFEIDYSQFYNPTNQNRPGIDLTPGLGSGLYANPTAPFTEEDFLDDSAFDHSLSDDEDMFESLKLELPKENAPPPPPPVPQPSGRGLYSAPLSWNRLQPSAQPAIVNMQNDTPRRIGGDAWGTVQQSNSYVITPEERRRLLEIALALRPQPPVEQNVRKSSEDTSGTSEPPPANRDLKHKQPPNDTTAKQSTASKRICIEPGVKPKSADRMAHNDVERKYRTNLKEKITELRNAVPALQQTDDAESSSAQGTAKVSKGTVLTKATEYIHQLEQRNKDIMTEHRNLMRRLQAFETLLNSSMRTADMMPSHSMTLFDPRGFC